ncbi:MAG: haloalkane dehalogenase [Nitriliruptor sp.]|uniref:haloalkane dehalogenase n=1 Tax=Nitriliruptor sp. TaxID=2448056 RepID=UPI0034A08832
MVDVRRRDEDRFVDLPGWEHEPARTEVEVEGTSFGLAHVEVGPGEGHPVVLLHGEPTWGYLYRTVLPGLAAAGLRAIAPDHVGFGRSDVPLDQGWFTYDRVVASFGAHLDAIVGDEPVTLVVHDWGGPIGLRWAVEHPERIARLVVLDTALYAPGGTPTEAWTAFRRLVEGADELPIGWLVAGGTVTELPAEVRAAYDAPFPDAASQAGAKALPLLVPTSDDDPAADAMWRTLQALRGWDHPTLIVWGGDDRILPPKVGERWARDVPGCTGLHVLPGAGHFLQEDAGPRIAELIVEHVRSTAPGAP